MINKARVHFKLFAVMILTATGLAGVQSKTPANPVQSLALSAPVPADPQLLTGKFPNGMTYYIRDNKKPEKRAELRLVVKTGSVLEDDDQRGLAHVVEHMAFDGTAHFPKKDIETFVQSVGMRFGADLNASTGYDETMYILRIPTDKPEVIDRAFQIMEDWAHNVSFDPVEMDKERNIVMEEWRLGLGAGKRNNEKITAVEFKGSRYADRMPIGKPEIIQGFKPERLKKFYTDWYRPDLMAIVAVGDFDKSAMEKVVRKYMASIPAATSPRPRPYFEVPDHHGTAFAIATDKENQWTEIEFDNLLPGRRQGSIAAYRQNILDGIFSDLISSRLDELTQKPNPPFVFAYAGNGDFLGRSCATCPTKQEASLYAEVKENGIDGGIQALRTEVARITRFGFTTTELEREKLAMLRNRERQSVDDINRPSANRVNSYINHFLNNAPIPTAATDYALYQRFLPDVTLDEINRLAKVWFPEDNRFFTITAPLKDGFTLPDEKTLRAAIDALLPKDLKPYVDSVGTATLLDSVPTPGSVVKTTAKDALGITEWELSNGVKVVLKPTTFREDEIVFRATSPGGTSLASDADYIPASTAISMLNAGGLGKFNAIDLQKVLTGKIAAANVNIAELQENVNGSGSRKDVETMFQLIYLRFTQPRSDPTAVAVMAEQAKVDLENQKLSPDFAFNEALTAIRYQNHIRRQLTTPATIDKWNLDKSMAFFKERFADASDFTFTFVGSFDLPMMKPLVERYLASLPSTRRKETWKDVGVQTPQAIIEKTVQKGVDPKGRTTILFTGPYEWNGSPGTALVQATGDILQRRLLESIREELGGAYTINAGIGTQKWPKPEYTVTIQFGHDPKRTDEIIKRIFQEIEQFKANGPTEKQLADEKEALRLAFETNSQQNAFLVNQISLRYWQEEDPATVWQAPDYIRQLNAGMVQQLAKTLLNTGRYVRVTLAPESK